MKQEMNIAHNDVQVLKAKVETFEDIVTSMEIGKKKNQQVCQENIKLTVKLRDLENEVRVLRELISEDVLGSQSVVVLNKPQDDSQQSNISEDVF